MNKILLVMALCLALASATMAGESLLLDLPDTVYTSNVSIEIIEHGSGVWLATDEGVNYSLDNGISWLRYDKTNGLASNNISALMSLGNRIWVASSHSDVIGGDRLTISDGLQYSDDNGLNWNLIDFDAQDILYATGGDRIVFDIAGHNDWVLASAFAGGMLATRDGGISWRRIFASASDSTNYYEGHIGTDSLSLVNRYFSCGIDTSRINQSTPWQDTVIIWSGTAGGLLELLFVDPHVKPYSQVINAVEFCVDCDGFGTDYVYLGGDQSFTRGSTVGAPYRSFFSAEAFGPPYPVVTALKFFGGNLFGGFDDGFGTNKALAMSGDHGDSWTTINLPQFSGGGVEDFEPYNSLLYIATGDSGLYITADSGQSYNLAVSQDTVSTAWSLFAFEDTLLIGTDTGLAIAFLSPAGTVDSTYFVPFGEDDSTSSKIIEVKIQTFIDTLTLLADSNIIWTVNRPTTASGTPMVGRLNWAELRPDTLEWKKYQVDAITNDVNFIENRVFVVGEESIRYTDSVTDTLGNPQTDFIVKMITMTGTLDSLSADTVTFMEIQDNLIYFGTTNGFAYSLNGGITFNIVRPLLDSLVPDVGLHLNSANTFGITGNWIPALKVQHFATDPADVWLSTRSTGNMIGEVGNGISIGEAVPRTVPIVDTIDFNDPVVLDTIGYDTIGLARIFGRLYADGFAWNFEFNGDTVFAATNGGLILHDRSWPDAYDSTLDLYRWDTLQFIDDEGNAAIMPDVPVYTVLVDQNILWVGTDDRMMQIDLNDLVVDKIFHVEDQTTPADEVYAFPVPFSNTRNHALDFHFVLGADANVTIEIYDFAMTLVKRVVDNQSFPAGIYPTSGPFRPTWDGRNGQGDPVAVGIYYFKVTLSTGDERWGKLAVTP